MLMGYHPTSANTTSNSKTVKLILPRPSISRTEMSDHVVGVAGLAIGVPGLIEVCVLLGDFLVTRLSTYRQADEKVADYLLRISIHWDNQKDTLKKLKLLEANLADDVKDRLAQVLKSLRRLLEKAAAILSRYTTSRLTPTSAVSPSVVQRLRYALVEERALASLDNDISAWEDRFMKRLVSLADVPAITQTHDTPLKPDG
jgi:hypothetical protein